MNGKVLITGAGGFIGARLVEELLTRGRRVVAVLRPGRPVPAAFAGRVDVIEADLEQWNPVRGEFAGVQTVFHLAGSYKAGSSRSTVEHLRLANVEVTRRVLSASIEAGVPRFLHFSSIAAGGDPLSPAAVTKLAPYGVSKLASESVVREAGTGRIAWTILRPVIVFGEHRASPITKIADAARKGRIFLIGDGSNRMSFIYVGDLVAAVLHAESLPSTHFETYVLAETSIELKNLAQKIQELIGIRSSCTHVPVWLAACLARLGDAGSAVLGRELPLTTSRLRNMTGDHPYSGRRFCGETGFEPPFGFEAGLRRTLGIGPEGAGLRSRARA